jgi:hypothetical protein
LGGLGLCCSVGGEKGFRVNCQQTQSERRIQMRAPHGVQGEGHTTAWPWGVRKGTRTREKGGWVATTGGKTHKLNTGRVWYKIQRTRTRTGKDRDEEGGARRRTQHGAGNGQRKRTEAQERGRGQSRAGKGDTTRRGKGTGARHNAHHCRVLPSWGGGLTSVAEVLLLLEQQVLLFLQVRQLSAKERLVLRRQVGLGELRLQRRKLDFDRAQVLLKLGLRTRTQGQGAEK